MSNAIIFIMKCGCELRKKDLISTKNGLVCRVHRERVSSRMRVCMDCTAIYPIGSMGIGSPRCENCRAIHAEKKRTEQKKDTPIAPKVVRDPTTTEYKKFCVDPRGGYCRYGLICQRDGILDCAGCDHFSPIIRGFDPGGARARTNQK